MDIQKIDPNFVVKSNTARENTVAYNAAKPPFSLHGLFPPQDPGDLFRRMPAQTAAAVSPGVEDLHAHCAGGRIRFRTDSAYIGIAAEFGNVGKMPHFALTGSAGFDLYCGREHVASFQPQFDIQDHLFGEVMPNRPGLSDYTLNLPLYSELKTVHILLDKDAALEAAAPYSVTKPVVFYGSSITQGGCASRPGNSYSAILSRRLDFDYWNLGFSGSAKGEIEMAKYIAGLDMSAFIFDYDHNAPSAEHLVETHEPFFQRVRKAHPHIPIICMNKPFFQREDCRDAVIRQTVDHALARGDRNVYFLQIGQWLEEKGIAQEGSVDRCHPNDLGFFYMAQALEELLETLKL